MKIVLWGRGRWLGPSGRERTRQGRVVKVPTSREAECWHQLPRNWTPPSAWACFCRIKLLLDNNPTSKHSIYCGTNWPKLESRQMIIQLVFLVNQIHVSLYQSWVDLGCRRCVSFLQSSGPDEIFLPEGWKPNHNQKHTQSCLCACS